MALPTVNVRLGEVRVDPTDGLKYRWNGSAWVLNGSGTGSSSGFPNGKTIGEVRTDITSGKSFRWSGSAWVSAAGLNDSSVESLKKSLDTDNDGVVDLAEAAAGQGVAQVTVASAGVKTLFATPVTLVPAPGAGKIIIVDRVTATIGAGTAYATNTTLEYRYTNASGTKVSADMSALLTSTTAKIQTVGGIEAVLTPVENAPVVVNVATGNPTAGTSDIKISVHYRTVTL